MLPNYFDSSAFTKLYHKEPGTPLVRELAFRSEHSVVISELTLVELESALATKKRMRTLVGQAEDIWRRRLRVDLASRRVQLGAQIERQDCISARALLGRFGTTTGLRTLDALQLAIALRLIQAERAAHMVTADKRLSQAARAAGCPIIEVTAE
ncbi:hypothetical protein F183_A26700 [Bryobacterales bacterium F-183]|nr:hypothetical protein F183_A26700 [Bryobacterales bacterium F-183]